MMAADDNKRNEPEVEAVRSNSGLRMAETLLRVAPIGLCLAAMGVMLKNTQDTDYGSISHSDLSAFRYLVYANGICAGYSLLSALYTALPLPFAVSHAWAIFVFDQVLTYVVLAAGAASAEVVYLAYEGDKEVTWSKGCPVFGVFCSKASASVGVTFGSVACYVVLSLVTSFRLFSSFDAPVPPLLTTDIAAAA